MTREEAKELLPIIQAFADGKTIEIYDEEQKTMVLKDPHFDCASLRYRIKHEPKYRPFKTQEECWNEMMKHRPFGWLFNKESECYVYPVLYTSITAVFADKSTANFNSMFKNYTFADGKLFGIKEK